MTTTAIASVTAKPFSICSRKRAMADAAGKVRLKEMAELQLGFTTRFETP